MRHIAKIFQSMKAAEYFFREDLIAVIRSGQFFRADQRRRVISEHDVHTYYFSRDMNCLQGMGLDEVQFFCDPQDQEAEAIMRVQHTPNGKVTFWNKQIYPKVKS